MPLGEAPELGTIPERMFAQVIRPERYGEPSQAFELEEVDTPMPGPGEVLVYVMAAGVNYNNVFAALGKPLDVVAIRQKAGEKEDFHIGGSDASGIVWAVGEGVTNVKVGEHVVAHCGVWDANDPWIVGKRRHPMTSETAQIWGYETNFGSFAQFTRVQAHQLLPKPPKLSWAAAGCYMLVGATAYRMLCGWEPHIAEKGEVVLIYGASGGLGCQATQIAKALGALPIAVVSSDERGEYCMKLGAAGYINRKDFDHWGPLKDLEDPEVHATWLKGARAFGKAIREISNGHDPRIVFEHPGEDTMPTSMYVCERDGMVVYCAGTSGYLLTLDARIQWMKQKTLQGSHFAGDKEAAALNALVISGQVKPCLERTFSFQEIGVAHQLMRNNQQNGNMAVLVGAKSANQLA
jgi:crotonyl-CoA carboxylase/reductase